MGARRERLGRREAGGLAFRSGVPYPVCMQIVLRHQGHVVTQSDVQFIRELIAAHPNASRRRLSELLCEARNFRQENGALRAMLWRSLMLALHRANHIVLPPPRWKNPNPLANRRAPQAADVDRTPVRGSLRAIGPYTFFQVKRTPQEKLFNGLMASEHYLGYAHPIGESLKFIVFAGLAPVALFAWGSAPRDLAPRDKYIGWSLETRRKNVHLVAYNTRFLVPSWVQVPHLASHLLSRMTKMLPQEWQTVYGHRVYFAETFVDTTRHRGTCYKAANWVLMGKTTGRGKNDHTNKPNRTLKDVLGLPLSADWRERLLTWVPTENQHPGSGSARGHRWSSCASSPIRSG
jgi:hypothetical protein